MAPETINIVGEVAHGKLTGFLAELRRAFSHPTRPVVVDFSKTSRLYPEATLLVFAEIDHLATAFPGKTRRCEPAINPTVDGVLQHLGVYERLNHRSPVSPQGDHVVGWKVHYGELVDGAVFGPPLEDIGLRSEDARQLYRGVSEAVTNVHHHAHLLPRKDGLQLPITRKWWMFIHESDTKLYVAVCDLGIGIPRSLPLSHGWETVRHAIKVMFGQRRRTDGMMIKAALRFSRSRTEAGHRGKGFSDMIAVLNTMPEGRMLVLSNHGAMGYNPSCRPPAIQVRSFKNSIFGTIIAWHFPKEGAHHEH